MADTFHPDLLRMIYESLPSRIDKIRFRSVCKQWRNSIPEPPIYPNFQFWNRPIPHPDLNQVDLILAECVVYYVKSTVNPSEKGTIVKICDLWNGQHSLALHPLGFYSHRSPLFFDFSHFRVYELGKSYFVRTLGPAGYFPILGKVVISLKDTSSGVKFNDTFRLMGILNNQLVHFKFGDNGGWSVLPDDARFTNPYKDIVHRGDKFYVVDSKGFLRIVDSSLNSEVVKFKCSQGHDRLFLLESRGQLYRVVLRIQWLVWPNYFSLMPQYRLHILVNRFSDVRRAWSWVSDLGDCAFFLEEFGSFSVAVTDDFLQLRRNHVYFCLQEGTYVIYNLGTKEMHWLYRNHPRIDNPFLWPPQ